MYSLEMRFNRKHLATYILLLLTTLVWLTQVSLYGSNVATFQNLLNSGALWGFGIIQHPHEIWRLFTAIFIHLSWSHYLMNMFTLLLIGRIIEEEFGSLRFVEIYLLSGLFANAFSFFLATASISAGASTSLFGIFGAMGTLGYFTGSPKLKEVGKGFLLLIVINLAMNVFQPGVSIVGHIGGVIGGGLLAGAWPPARYQKWLPKRIQLFCGILLVLLFVLFIFLTFLRYNT